MRNISRIFVPIVAAAFVGTLAGTAPSAHASSPILLISPTSLDFATQALSQPSSTQTVDITNVSGVTQHMNGTGGAGGVFGGVQDCQGTDLAPNATCHMYYAFTPDALGPVTAGTTGTWNGQSYALHFRGVGTPEFRISPTALDFGRVAVGTTSPAQQVDVTNLGSVGVLMNGTGGAGGQFGGVQNCQGTVLAGGATCHMFYEFTPTGMGTVTGRASGTWNAQPFVIHFTGVGIEQAADDYVPEPASRVLDTRRTHRIRGGHTLALPLPSGLVPATAVAADLTVTSTGAKGDGRLTVWPCGQPPPRAATILFSAGHAISNHVTAPLGTGASVCLRPSKDTDVLVDVDGYYPATTGYHPLVPARVLDTRTGREPRPGTVTRIKVIGKAVPPMATAVALNLTALDEAGAGRLTVWPCGGTAPATSALSFRRLDARSALAVSAIGAHGTVCVRTSDRAQIFADLDGWYTAATTLHAVKPHRVLDTERHIGHHGTKPKAGSVTAATPTGVPGDARAVVVAVTAAAESAAGTLTVFPCGASTPSAVTVAYSKNVPSTDLAITQPGTGGKLCVRTSASSHLAMDVVGWYAAAQS